MSPVIIQFALYTMLFFVILYIMYDNIKGHVKTYNKSIDYLKSLDIVNEEYDLKTDTPMQQSKEARANIQKMFNYKFNIGHLRLFVMIIKQNEKVFYILNKIRPLDIIKLLRISGTNASELWKMGNNPDVNQKRFNKFMYTAVKLTLRDFDETKHDPDDVIVLKSIVTYIVQINSNPSKESLQEIKKSYMLCKYDQTIFDGVINELLLSGQPTGAT